MELFLLYLWLKLDAIRTSLGIVGGLAAFIFILWRGVAWIIRGDCTTQREIEIHAWAFQRYPRKRIVSGLILCMLLAVIMPSQRDAAILGGAYIALEVGKSPEGMKVSKLVRQKLNDYLDSELTKTGVAK